MGTKKKATLIGYSHLLNRLDFSTVFDIQEDLVYLRAVRMRVYQWTVARIGLLMLGISGIRGYASNSEAT